MEKSALIKLLKSTLINLETSDDTDSIISDLVTSIQHDGVPQQRLTDKGNLAYYIDDVELETDLDQTGLVEHFIANKERAVELVSQALLNDIEGGGSNERGAILSSFSHLIDNIVAISSLQVDDNALLFVSNDCLEVVEQNSNPEAFNKICEEYLKASKYVEDNPDQF